MRDWINLFESAEHFPATLYHGTSDKQWAMSTVSLLYVTTSLDDATNYADEAVTGDFNALGIDYEEGMEMPSKSIIVTFNGSDLIAMQNRFEPDWGWDGAEDATWRESLDAVGSFCISDFSEKNLGKISDAF